MSVVRSLAVWFSVSFTFSVAQAPCVQEAAATVPSRS